MSAFELLIALYIKPGVLIGVNYLSNDSGTNTMCSSNSSFEL